MLSADPYVPRHLENTDFDDGSDKWKFSPAEQSRQTGGEQASMDVKFRDGYGTVQGRRYNYGIGAVPPDAGTRFLWTKRCEQGPNICTQKIKNLEPGRVYSLKAVTADYGDMVALNHEPKVLSVRIAIDGVELLPEESFQEVMTNRSGRATEFCMNFHRIIFRATSNTARLVISDWISDEEPGGPIGQEITYNYLQLMPFLED